MTRLDRDDSKTRIHANIAIHHACERQKGIIMLATKELIDICRKVLKEFGTNEDQLSKQQVLAILGSKNEKYYGLIIDALAEIGKITKVQGRSGGIQYRAVQKQTRTIAANNEKKLELYFGNSDLEIPEIKPEEYDDLYINDNEEADIYEPLMDYLVSSGYYKHVEIIGDLRSGKGKWKNPDLVALQYSNNYKYHLGLFPKLFGFEVKKQWPSIRDIQQTASYFRYCHYSYLCFFDESYKGSDVNKIIQKVKNEEIWDWASISGIGLIVCYKKQDRSVEYAFQVILESKMQNRRFSLLRDAEKVTIRSSLVLTRVLKKQRTH